MSLVDDVDATLECLQNIIRVLDDIKREAASRSAQRYVGPTKITNKDWSDIVSWLSDTIKNEENYRTSFIDSIKMKDADKLGISASNVLQSFKYFSDTDLGWSKNEKTLLNLIQKYTSVSKWKSRMNPFKTVEFEQAKNELGWQ